MTTVLICDDRRQVRDGLTRVISRVTGVQRIELSEYGELVSRYARNRTDLVLVGTHRTAPMGLDAVRRLLLAQPRANVIAFGAPHDAANIAEAIAAGARGFLRWDTPHAESVATLGQVVAGTVAPNPGQPGGASELRLTEREMQVLQGMSKGLSNGQIGRNLFLSEDTIKTHARRLFRKLGAHDRAEAVALGFRRSFIS